jgi:hypothetical protein
VGTIEDPGELVGHDRTEQVAVAVRLDRPVAPGKLQYLVDVQLLVPTFAGSVCGPIGDGAIEPGSGEQLTKGSRLGFVGDRVNP